MGDAREPRAHLFRSLSHSGNPSYRSLSTSDHHSSNNLNLNLNLSHGGGHGNPPSAGIGGFPIHPCASSDVSCNPNPNPKRKPKKWSSLMKEAIHREKGISAPMIRAGLYQMLVPKALYEVRPQAYSPQFLFVGPHNDRSSRDTLSFMDYCRALCVKQFLARCGFQQLDCLTAALFRGGQNPELDDPDMETLEVLTAVDSVFVLDFILSFMKDHTQCPLASSVWDQYFNTITLCQMQRDLFMLGNQVPLMFLVNLARYQGLEEEKFSHVLWRMIWDYSPFNAQDKESGDPDFKDLLTNTPLHECDHLLHCLYKVCVMKIGKEDDLANESGSKARVLKSRSCYKMDIHESQSPTSLEDKSLCLKPGDRIPRASELCKVGVKFEAVYGTATAIDYNKKNLIVKLPKLVVDNGTECKLRNLVAYELTSHCNSEWEICTYVMLMDSLIDKIDDLEILYKAEVLHNHLGSDEKLITMWNEMRANIQLPITKKQTKMTLDITIPYRTCWRKIYVEFQRRFFSRPWYTLSALAAVLLLLMTALQTIYSVMGAYKG